MLPNLLTGLLQGFKEDQIECEHYLNLRYDGTDVAMMTKKSSEEETYEQVSSPRPLFYTILIVFSYMTDNRHLEPCHWEGHYKRDTPLPRRVSLP